LNYNRLFIYFQTRLSAIVIPRFDAESIVCDLNHWAFPVFSGFRVEARNDNYREPHLKAIVYYKLGLKLLHTMSEEPSF